jgi:hypothetical protein
MYIQEEKYVYTYVYKNTIFIHSGQMEDELNP